jgi:hypothetical protein
MKKYLNDYISENPIISGMIFFLIAFMLLVWRIYKKDRFRMKDYSVLSWKTLVNSWALIIMLTIAGIFLIIRNL